MYLLFRSELVDHKISYSELLRTNCKLAESKLATNPKCVNQLKYVNLLPRYSNIFYLSYSIFRPRLSSFESIIAK